MFSAHSGETNGKVNAMNSEATSKLVYGECGPDVFTVVCQHCGYNYLHHRAIDVHERPGGEDATTTSRRVYGADGPLTSNPSGRRDGLVILLECEGCGGETFITLEQHKGQTFMDVTRGQTPDEMRRR